VIDQKLAAMRFELLKVRIRGGSFLVTKCSSSIELFWKHAMHWTE
jgi:hypothetical protein